MFRNNDHQTYADKWFSGWRTLDVEAIKAQYRKHAKTYHPDIAADKAAATAAMQEINPAYHYILERKDGSTYTGSDDQEHTYRYDAAKEEKMMQEIADVIGMLHEQGQLEHVEIWRIGTWLWMWDIDPSDKEHGTYHIRALLKTRPWNTDPEDKVTWQFHGKRKAWFIHWDEKRAFYNPHVDLAGIAATYGAQNAKGLNPEEDEPKSQGKGKTKSKRRRYTKRIK